MDKIRTQSTKINNKHRPKNCAQKTALKIMLAVLKGQYHAIFSNTLKIERRYSVSSQDIMTKIPLKYYQNAKKLSTDVFAGR